MKYDQGWGGRELDGVLKIIINILWSMKIVTLLMLGYETHSEKILC